MSRRAVLLTLLSRSTSQANQIYALVAFAEERDLRVTSLVTGDLRAAINAVQVGTADVILTEKPDYAGVLLRSPVPVVYLRPPAAVMAKPDALTVGGIPGLLVLQALERTGGDVTLIARIFDLPVAMVEELDVERRRRTAAAA